MKAEYNAASRHIVCCASKGRRVLGTLIEVVCLLFVTNHLLLAGIEFECYFEVFDLGLRLDYLGEGVLTLA